MDVYAIGDVQGCANTLQDLVDQLPLRPPDRLWLAGDLVNRGPHSLEVLRWALEHEGRLVCVLGNHDVHLLARAFAAAPSKSKDTLDAVLAAPDADGLLGWLLRRPLLHHEADHLLLHAGLLPAWTLDTALERGSAARQRLLGADREALLRRVTGIRRHVLPDEGLDRDANTLRALGNLRICDAAGLPRYEFTGAPEEAPPGTMAWYDHPARATRGVTVVCGHWAAQGVVLGPDHVALDSGCVWGGRLSAVRLGDRRLFSVPLRDPVAPALLRRHA